MEPTVVAAASATRVIIDGAQLVSFAGCSYLGLHAHPQVLAAARAGLDQHGLSNAASRTTSGTHPEHIALERALERALGGSALLLPDGWLANAALAEGLREERPHALVDSHAHASILAAQRGAGIRPRVVERAELAGALAELPRGSASYWVDGYEPGRGVLAPCDELLALCGERAALLVVDDAHGLGVGGERGLGAGEGRRDSIERGELALTLALSKSLGVAGGAVLVAPDLAASLRRDSSCYAGTTPILPAIAAAARAGLALLSDDDTLVGRMRANAARVRALLASHGWLDGAGPALPVAGVAAPGGRDVRELSEALAAHGVYVPVVGYAGGPASTWLRFAASAAHSGSDLHALERALAAVT